MLSNLLHTFPRKPKLRIDKDGNGKPCATVHIYMLPPFWVIIRDKTALIISIALLVWSIIYGLESELEQASDWFPVILFPTLTYYPLLIGFEHLFTHCKKIILTQNDIQYRKSFRLRHFDRQLPHSFVLMPHHFGALEKNWHEHRIRHDRTERKSNFRKQYFQQAYCLCLIHAEISYEIAVIFSQKRAQHCLSYLNSAEARIDGSTQYGKGFVIDGASEWRPQSGNLPENPRQYH